ncbi:hypothetical protein J5X84_36010 [Streptosporangiaceae bacterium NEAU-GS5]|nr:hypothetical protein [Streptosporangiaceae bacterium NEAU-GS5]
MSATPDQPPPLRIVRGDQARGGGDEPHPDRVQRPGLDGVIRNDWERSGTLRPGAERLATDAERAGVLEVRGDSELAERDPSDDVREIEGRIVDRPDTSIALRVAGRVARLPRSERLRLLGQALLREVWTTAQGGHSWAARAWDARTHGVYRRQIRALDAMGDRAALAEWLDRHNSHANDRARRAMDRPNIVVGILKILIIIVVVVPILLLLTSLLVWWTGGQFATVWIGAAAVLRFVFDVIDFMWHWVLPAVPCFLLVAMRREGRRRGITPAWLVPPSERSRDTSGEPITPSIVVTALRDLGLAELRKAIAKMGDAGAGMLSPIAIAGCGVEVDVSLPSGVSTDEVLKRRRKFAENLGRHEHEVFLTIPPQPRTVRVWAADSGALDEPIGPSPLVTDPDARSDYKSGRAPWGQDLRGDPVAISLFQRHVLCTGLSNQGKTAALRALALWLAKDPSVEFRIADLKGFGDWSMFDGLATVLIEGPTDEHVIAATEMLEQGVAEMERRIQAPAGTKFDPLLLIVDEAQVAFMCPEKDQTGRPYGGTKATSRYFRAVRKIHNQGRAVDVLLWQGTQDPTDQNLPKLVREGAHIRASLVVGTEEQARMALGDKAIDGGAAPHKLRQGLDKGVLVSNGEGLKLPPGQSSLTIRTHFVDGDEAADVADRAKAGRRGVRTLTAVETLEEERDLLADLDEVLEAERIKLSDATALLRELAPTWPAYASLTGAELARLLDAEGVRWTRTGNVMRLDPDDVRQALELREGE